MAIGSLSPDLISLGTSEEPHLGRRVSSEIETADVVLLGSGDSASETRRLLYRYSLGLSGELAELQLADLGDFDPSALEGAVSKAARSGAALVVVGDASSAGMSGTFGARPGRGAIVAVDTGLSTSKLMFDRWSSRIAALVVVGVQPQYGSKSHADFLRAKGGRTAPLDDLRSPPGVVERMRRELGATAGTGDFAAVSLELRSRAGEADGLSAEELARFCEHAGRHPKVQLLTLVEPSPPQLAALCVWRFLLGVAMR